MHCEGMPNTNAKDFTSEDLTRQVVTCHDLTRHDTTQCDTTGQKFQMFFLFYMSS